MSVEKNIALLCNPLAASGRSALLAEKIAHLLAAQTLLYRLFTSEWPAQFNGFTDVFIVGGDGTLNYFVNHYPGIALPLAVFKGGTGNDFHWMLYGDLSLEEQLQLVLKATAKKIDLGKCNNRYFLNEAGIGFEGVVVKALTGRKKRPGKASFMFTILKKIFSYRSEKYTIAVNGQVMEGKKMLIDISNGCRAGGGFFVAPTSMADDGLFDVVMCDALMPLQRLRYLPVIEKGKHLGKHFIQHIKTDKLAVESEHAIQYHLDGEYYEALKLEIEILPGCLTFLY
jgi:diacylglycerol kinase (ATP)